LSGKTRETTQAAHGSVGQHAPASPYLVHEVHTLAQIVYQRLSNTYPPVAVYPVRPAIGQPAEPAFMARPVPLPWATPVPTFYWYP
jgi:hypothetical protein